MDNCLNAQIRQSSIFRESKQEYNHHNLLITRLTDFHNKCHKVICIPYIQKKSVVDAHDMEMALMASPWLAQAKLVSSS